MRKENNGPGPTLIIDGFNMLIRAFVVLPTMNDDGEHSGGLFGSLQSLKSYVKKFKPSRVIVAWDGPGGSKRRQKLYTNYKSTRKVPRRLCRVYDFLTPEQESESMFAQLDRFKEYLNQLPVYQLRVELTEADDLIAWATHHVDNDVIIASTDKDFLQLISPRVRVYNPVTKVLINENDVFKKFGARPKNFVLCRTLVGDASDNISGIKGIGMKTAIKLFPDINNDDTLYPVDMFEYAKNHLDEKPKYSKILEHKDVIDVNYKIMQLREPLVSAIEMTKMASQLDQQLFINLPALRMLFIQDKLWGQIRNFDDWIINFLPLGNKV